MNVTIKKIFSGRNFFILGILLIIITFCSTYVLGNLITDISEEANAVSTERSFLKRQEVLAQEFLNLQKIKDQVATVVEVSSLDNLSNNLLVLSAVHKNDSLIKNNWFQVNQQQIQFTQPADSSDLQFQVDDLLQHSGDKSEFNQIIKEDKFFLWRLFFKTLRSDGSIVRYGYDIDLEMLQSYFFTVDQSAQNYAFVFDQNGTLVYHPEIELLGKNIFELTNLQAQDTIFKNSSAFSKQIGMSEYLHLDVVRYTKRLNLPGTKWYVSANFPKNIATEDVNSIKQYASLIYFINTAILVISFYLFTIFSRRNFREKELLTEDRNKLLIENETINKEKAIIQLQQLKNQINPHFLFNSLNSLYMLIAQDNKVARKFTLNLSKIYRYLINPPTQNIVSVAEELEFIEKYIFLQQTRFTTEFIFTINIIDENSLSKKVPYLAFQIAVENAIKHNAASEDCPLHITIDIKSTEVNIKNNITKRLNPNKESKFGHKYLTHIYLYYTKTGFNASKHDEEFIITLPLI